MGDRGLRAESVSQGEKEKWDKNRAGVDWWHSGKVSQGEKRCDGDHSGRKRWYQTFKVRGRSSLLIVEGRGQNGVRKRQFCIFNSYNRIRNFNKSKCIFSQWEWWGSYSLLHPVCDILGCSAIVFIVMEELPLPKRQQSTRKISAKDTIMAWKCSKGFKTSSKVIIVIWYKRIHTLWIIFIFIHTYNILFYLEEYST